MVSYVSKQDRTFLGNAAIAGSVYEVSLKIIIMPPPCCENASQMCSLKRSVKKMKFVVSSSGVFVICAKEVCMATSQPCGIRRVLLRSSDRKRCS